MKSIFKNVEAWAYGLFAALIGGGATAVSTWLGVAVAHQLGASVQPLDIETLKIVFISGSLTNVFFYLKQSPLPEKGWTEGGEAPKSDPSDKSLKM